MTARSPEMKGTGQWVATVLVVASILATLFVLSGASIYTFGNTAADLRFIDLRRPPTFEEAWIASTMDYAVASADKNDVIFLGDSECRTAVDTVQFESLTRLRGFNLGIVGDLGPDVRLDLVQAYLSAHLRPQIVVLCVSPVGMERDVPPEWQLMRDRCVQCYGASKPGRWLDDKQRYSLRQGALLAWADVRSAVLRERRDIRDVPLMGAETESYRAFDNKTALCPRLHASVGKQIRDPLASCGGRRIGRSRVGCRRQAACRTLQSGWDSTADPSRAHPQ